MERAHAHFARAAHLAALFEPVGCAFGYTVASLAKLELRDRIAVALETGVQNYTLVIGIVALTYRGCTRVEALTFVLIASLWYIFSSTWIVVLLQWHHGTQRGKTARVEFVRDTEMALGQGPSEDGWTINPQYGWVKNAGGGGGGGGEGIELTKA